MEIYALDASNTFIPANVLLTYVTEVQNDERLARISIDITVSETCASMKL